MKPGSKSRHALVAAAAIFAVVFIGAKVGCRAKQVYHDPVPLDRETFATADPAADALARYRRAADYSRDEDGRALLILHGDEIVFEEYQNGHDPEAPLHIFSATKSFAGVMAMAAVADGFLDLDEPVAETITEWKDDPRKSRITARQILHFTSGIEQSFLALSSDGWVAPEQQRVPDKYRYAIELDADHDPGSRYSYGSVHLMLFGELMKRKLDGRDPLAYLDERVLSRIGFRWGGWNRDKSGNSLWPYGCWATARELAKLGVLVRDDGLFGRERILPAGLLHGCLTGSEAMPAYGLTFWLNEKVPEPLRRDLIPGLGKAAKKGRLLYADGPADLAVAAGHNGNRVYVCPSRDLVIVRLAVGNGMEDAELLRLIFENDAE